MLFINYCKQCFSLKKKKNRESSKQTFRAAAKKLAPDDDDGSLVHSERGHKYLKVTAIPHHHFGIVKSKITFR